MRRKRDRPPVWFLLGVIAGALGAGALLAVAFADG